MALNSRRGLKDLVARRNKGSSSKEAPKTQLPPNPPLPPLPSPLDLLPNPNLQKKKRKEKDIEGGVGEIGPLKQQKTAKDCQGRKNFSFPTNEIYDELGGLNRN